MRSPEIQLPDAIIRVRQVVRTEDRGFIDVFARKIDGQDPVYVASKRGLMTHARRGRARHLLYGSLASQVVYGSVDELEVATGSHIIFGDQQEWSRHDPGGTIETGVYSDGMYGREAYRFSIG